MSALTLFDVDPPARPVPATDPGVDWDALDDIALLFTASEKGNNSGIRFAMSREHARAWCSSDLSRGNLHGTNWAYFFTSVSNFVRCHWGPKEPKEPKIVIAKLVDNGQWDARIASLGLAKIALADLPALLTPLGVEVVR